MDRLQTIAAEVINGDAEAKIAALLQLSVAIALFISDLDSSMQIALVIQLIESILVEVGHQAPSIALGHLKRIASSLEGLHLQCSMVYCTYSGALMDSTLHPTMLAFNCFATCQFASPGMPAGLATHLIRYAQLGLPSGAVRNDRLGGGGGASLVDCRQSRQHPLSALQNIEKDLLSEVLVLLESFEQCFGK